MVNESTNIVDNVCLWDGNTASWQPPEGYLMLVQDTTPAMVWGLAPDKTNWILVEQIGVGGIGFTWDGTFAITNDPKPSPITQPVIDGTQTL